jgi:transposase-like protein
VAALNAPHFHDDERAREYLETLRWPDGPVCPHCGSTDRPYKLKGATHRLGLWKCSHCREQFSVTVGTVFERSKIPLSKWLAATYLLCSSKKGISSHQLHRTLGLTYKTAWFMSHRIREAMRDVSAPPLGGPTSSGVVEADETYLGKTQGTGRGPRRKQQNAVVALVERKGRARAFHVPVVTAATLKPIFLSEVAKSARLMTDGATLYRKLGKHFARHDFVDHYSKEYARAEVTTNTVEGFFGVLKRGIRGVYQHVSSEHLSRCLDEFAFRHSNRASLSINDSQRAASALIGIAGKRLTYAATRTHAR